MNAFEPVENTPFFLVGCVRSGTTLLRDLLRLHPRLECPEETHFFRWADPFGSWRYRNQYAASGLLQKHREMDGFEEFPFHYILKHSHNRREMMDNYGRKFLEFRGNPEGRWFDKTPQNVYGVLLISAAYPGARFVHICRHPLNVVASLMEGAVMPEHDLDAAINYWVEAASILDQFKLVAGERLFTLRYETLTASPAKTLAELLAFLGEEPLVDEDSMPEVHPEQNKYQDKLSEEQVEEVLLRTEPYLSRLGYERPA